MEMSVSIKYNNEYRRIVISDGAVLCAYIWHKMQYERELIEFIEDQLAKRNAEQDPDIEKLSDGQLSKLVCGWIVEEYLECTYDYGAFDPEISYNIREFIEFAIQARMKTIPLYDWYDLLASKKHLDSVKEQENKALMLSQNKEKPTFESIFGITH